MSFSVRLSSAGYQLLTSTDFEAPHEMLQLQVALQLSARIVLPNLVLAEIAGALSRSFRDPIRARLAVDLLRDLHMIQLIPLDDSLAQAAAELAADRALRGADAVQTSLLSQAS